MADVPIRYVFTADDADFLEATKEAQAAVKKLSKEEADLRKALLATGVAEEDLDAVTRQMNATLRKQQDAAKKSEGGWRKFGQSLGLPMEKIEGLRAGVTELAGLLGPVGLAAVGTGVALVGAGVAAAAAGAAIYGLVASAAKLVDETGRIYDAETVNRLKEAQEAFTLQRATIEDLTVEWGSRFAPAVTDTVNALTNVIAGLDVLATKATGAESSTEGLGSVVGRAADATTTWQGTIQTVAGMLGPFGVALGATAAGISALNLLEEEGAAATEDLSDAIAEQTHQRMVALQDEARAAKAAKDREEALRRGAAAAWEAEKAARALEAAVAAEAKANQDAAQGWVDFVTAVEAGKEAALAADYAQGLREFEQAVNDGKAAADAAAAADAKAAADEQERLDKRKKNWLDFAGNVASAYDSITGSIIQAGEMQIDALDKTTKAGRKQALEIFRRNKLLAESQILVNTASAIIATFASMGGFNPFSAAAAGLMLAAGIAQGAVVAKTQPSFPQGGTQASDHYTAAVAPGESVLTRQATARAGGPAGVAAMNAGAGGGSERIIIPLSFRGRVVDTMVAEVIGAVGSRSNAALRDASLSPSPLWR